MSGPADLIVTGADCLVTMTGTELSGGWVSVRDGRVDAVGPPGHEPPANEVLRADRCLVTPGLINTHHHMFQNLTRSFGPVANRDFISWWERLGQIWVRLDEEASYVSTWIGLAELALGGCTTTTDHLYAHPKPKLVDAQIAAARDVGLRFHPVRGARDVRQSDGGVLPDALAQDVDTILADCERLVNTYHDPSPGSMIQIALGPNTSEDSSPRLYREAAQLAERLDVRMHTHFASYPTEESFALERFGMRPLEHLDEIGWGTDRSWIAHGIFMGEDEVARLSRWGTGVSHCPSSGMMISAGIAPVPEMRSAGVPVGLGCDGSASTDHASLWLEARTALLIARARLGPTSLSARDVLEIATLGSAACLGRAGELGTLKPGSCADLVAWPLDSISFAGAWSDPVEAWLRCGPISARHTVVGGRVVVRNGELSLPNLDEMLSEHERISKSWQAVA